MAPFLLLPRMSYQLSRTRTFYFKHRYLHISQNYDITHTTYKKHLFLAPRHLYSVPGTHNAAKPTANYCAVTARDPGSRTGINIIFADPIPLKLDASAWVPSRSNVSTLRGWNTVRKHYLDQELHRYVTDCERIIEVLLVVRHHSLDRASVPKSVPKRCSLSSLCIILDRLDVWSTNKLRRTRIREIKLTI
jgi:hypothetical protein